MNDHRGAAAVDDAVVAAGRRAAEGGRHFQFDVARERLDLVPDAAVGVETADAELGEVGHEDVVEVDEDAAVAGMDAANAQGHQHRVGVGRFDGLGDRRALLGLEVDVAANQMHLVADALEHQHPLLVEIERVAAHADAAGDGDGAEQRLVELMRLDFRVKTIVLVIELEKTFIFLGPFHELIEVLELLFGRGRVGAARQQQRQCRRRQQ